MLYKKAANKVNPKPNNAWIAQCTFIVCGFCFPVTIGQVIADVLKDAIGKFLESDLPSLLFAPEAEVEDVTEPELE